MAEVATTEPTPTNPEPVVSVAEDMELVDNSEAADAAKRAREEPEATNGDASKKQKVEEKSAEEDRLEGAGTEVGKSAEEVKEVCLGPKKFGTAVEMFDYFFKLLHVWPPNVDLNKYEHMVMLDLLKKGHQESEKKIGTGVKSFQIRNHPMWKSRCFFIIREDESVEDFSFRKCVDHILPLPEDMKTQSGSNGGGKGHGNGGGRGRGGRGRGRGGRGKKW
ncbi:Protein EMBRYO DEFECTIVE 514 [Linum perenne]